MNAQRLDLVLLAALFGMKVWINEAVVDWWYDGGYYADIARHVADGHGLVSSISMFHAGFPTFPHPTAVYPLWPLLLGNVARVVPLELAAVWLPTALYLAALAVVARVGRRMLPTRPFEALPFDGGHLTLLAWGLANRFVEFTSRPYTEGLGLLLLALTVLRVGTSRPTVAAGVEAGLWCALLVLARGPFIVPAAVILGLLWLGGGALRRGLAATLTFGAAAVLADQLWFRNIPGATVMTLLRFDHWVVTPGLQGVDLFVKPPSAMELLADRFKGISAAYSIVGNYRIMKNFGFLAFLPFLLVVPAFARAAWTSIRESLLVRLAVGIGLAQLALLHVLHKQEFAEWNFPLRHALPVLWLYVGLLPAALGSGLVAAASGRTVRALAAALLAIGLGQGLEMSMERRGAIEFERGERSRRIRAADWMTDQLPFDSDLRIAHTAPQLYARHAPGVGFIALHPFTTLDDLRHMVRLGGLDYLMMVDANYDGDNYAFLADPAAFSALFATAPNPPRGSRIYAPRPESL